MLSHSWLAALRAEPWRAMRARPVVCLVAIAGLAASTGRADEGPLTLSNAVSRALAGGAAARIARLETHQATDAAREKRGAYLPQLGITSDAGWSNRYEETFTALAPDGSSTVTLGLATLGTDRGWLNIFVSQILFDLKQWKLIEREELMAEATAVQETSERDDVAFEVLRRYVNLLGLQRKQTLAHELLADAQWLREQGDLFFEAGRILEVEHTLAGLYLEEAELDALAKGHEIAIAEADLWLAVGEGEPPAGRLRLVPESLPRIDAAASEESAEAGLKTAPELRILELQRRMDEVGVAAARAGRLPTLTFVSGYTNYGPKRFDNFTDEFWVGINLEIPLFDGFQSRHAIRGAERGAEIARLRYQSTVERKRARVRELLKRLEMSQQRLEIAERRAKAAKEQQRLADVNLRAERGDLREALIAREQQIRFTREAIDSYFDQLALWASLQRELGRLSQEILRSAAATPAVAP
ncbi:MAG: TolC family protein [Deltaproteobacteria bacterium]|nr:TolC family protein [Deltaproteobacteria bacterium]